MYKRELNPKQVRDFQVFNLIFDDFGWGDISETERAFDQGGEMSPEGKRDYVSTSSILCVHLHLPLQMLSLQIRDQQTDDYRNLHFIYEYKPDNYLTWIGNVKDDITIHNYPKWVRQTYDLKGIVILQLPDGRLFDLNLHWEEIPEQIELLPS